MRALLVALLLVACGTVPAPAAPADPAGYTCETACARLTSLACETDSSSCVADCRDVTAAEQGTAIVFPVGCLSVAATCEEASACR